MTSAAVLIGIGRVVLGLFFIIAGVRNFANFSRASSNDTNYGWKLPKAIVAIGFAAQVIGGLSVVLGVLAPWGAALLILFLIGATSFYHNPLMFKGEARLPHIYFLLVNITLASFCLTVIGETLAG